MLRKINTKALPVYISFMLTIVLVVLVYVNLGDYPMGWFLTSDTLYLPSIFRDLIHDNAQSVEWITPAATCFFPDLILFFIVHFFTSNFQVAMFVTGIIFNTLLILALYLIVKEAFRNIPLVYCSMAINLMLLFHLAFLIQRFHIYSFYLTITNYHLGAFIGSLYALYFVFRYLNRGMAKNLVISGAIYMLTVASDFLTIFYLIIPILSLSYLFIKPEWRKKALWIQVYNVISFTLGFLLYRGITLSKPISILDAGFLTYNFERVSASYNYMLNHHLELMTSDGLQSAIFALCIISFLFSVYQLTLKLSKFFNEKKLSKKDCLELSYLMAFIALVVGTYNAPAINGLYNCKSIFRYNVYVLFITIFNYAYIAYALSNKQKLAKFVKLTAYGILLIAIGFSLWHIRKTILKNPTLVFFNFYPDEVQDLDEISKQYDLKQGVASYWVARRAFMLSRQKVKVYQVYPDMRPITSHVLNVNWFYGSKDGKVPPPIFNFVVTRNLTDSIIDKKIGSHIIDTVDVRKTRVIITESFTFNPETKLPVFRD